MPRTSVLRDTPRSFDITSMKNANTSGFSETVVKLASHAAATITQP